MGRKPALVPSRQETVTERASRVRDNKRRHRARQKEYVLDLERRLAETREEGVQATKEVQLAAQRVARENARLRELLKTTGYTDEAIDSWAKGGASLHGGDHHCQLLSTSTCNKNNKDTEKTGRTECLTKAPSPPADSEVRRAAPCKLITLLAANPAADITQVPLPLSCDQAKKTSDDDGVECATAYNMLMQYATSDEKMDRIAVALEGGCTPCAGGGCKVKKSVVWKTLDEECT